MASLRKRYTSHDDAPVTSAPRPSAAAPPPAVEHPEPPKLEQERPEEVAARNAMKARLAELENAEALAREPVDARRAPEPQQQPQMHPRIQKWLERDPRLQSDLERIAEANYLHHKATRETDGQGEDAYYNRMEQLLFAPASNGKHLPPAEPQPAPYNGAPRTQAPRPSTPAPRTFSQQPPAAPPTRQGYSVTTGRPTSSPLRPTEADYEGARIAGIDIQTYMEGKRRFLAEQAAGMHQNG